MKAKTVKIGSIEFNVKACKAMTKTKFTKAHKSLCEKFNVDVEQAWEIINK